MKLLWIALIVVGIVLVVTVLHRMRDAAARRSGLLPPEGQATMADVERLVRSGNKIAAIRCYREIHDVGLAEAKKAVEGMVIQTDK